MGGAAEAEQVARWLATPPGRARLVAALDRRRLPSSLVDDLGQDVVLAALLAAEPIESPEAWATAVAARRAVDLVRARVRRPVTALDPWLDEPAPEPGPGPAEALELAGAGDEARRRLAGVVPVVVRSAALTSVTVAVDGVPLPPDCPQPGQGAAADDLPLWVGVWFAGGHDCWAADPGADTPAIRKRRSRALAAARTALAEAVR